MINQHLENSNELSPVRVKKCSYCSTFKKITEFHRKLKYYRSRCKVCTAENARTHKEKMLKGLKTHKDNQC